MVGQVTPWLNQNLKPQVSPAPIAQRQPTPQVDASALHTAVLQHQAEADEPGAQTSGAAPARAATVLEPAAIIREHSQALASERDRGAALASELAMARGDVGTKTVSKAAAEATQPGQTAEATAAELRQSLLQERDRVAALAHELATARRDLETEVALSRKAGEEAEQLRQAAKGATEELEQQRNRSAMGRDLKTAQRVIGTRSPTERPAGGQIDPMKQVTEQAATEPPRTAVQGNREATRLISRASALLVQGNIAAARVVLERAAETGSAEANFALAETYDPKVLARWRAYGTRGDAAKARDLYARAYDGGVRAAKDRSRALVVGEGAPKPAGWFGREEADH